MIDRKKQQDFGYQMPVPWRIVARENPFVPWVTVGISWNIELATKRAAEIKRAQHFYAVHVRAN